MKANIKQKWWTAADLKKKKRRLPFIRLKVLWRNNCPCSKTKELLNMPFLFISSLQCQCTQNDEFWRVRTKSNTVYYRGTSFLIKIISRKWPEEIKAMKEQSVWSDLLTLKQKCTAQVHNFQLTIFMHINKWSICTSHMIIKGWFLNFKKSL